MEVEALPRRAYKTTLQRTVQALKRHRDIFFAQDRDNRPTSIIITTLAAQAYEPAGDLFSVLHHVVEWMPDLVECEFGKYVIANPVESQENFADRWKGHPARPRRFFEWLEAALRDFTAIGDARGTDEIVRKTARALGAGPAEAAQRVDTNTSFAVARPPAAATVVPAGGDRFA
jgi:hypothetical protein